MHCVCLLLLENTLHKCRLKLRRPTFICKDGANFRSILLLCEFDFDSFNDSLLQQENRHLCFQLTKLQI